LIAVQSQQNLGIEVVLNVLTVEFNWDSGFSAALRFASRLHELCRIAGAGMVVEYMSSSLPYLLM